MLFCRNKVKKRLSYLVTSIFILFQRKSNQIKSNQIKSNQIKSDLKGLILISVLKSVKYKNNVEHKSLKILKDQNQPCLNN